jgi:hypothetical protein
MKVQPVRYTKPLEDKSEMVITECPWCAEAVEVGMDPIDALVCAECQIEVEIAADSIGDRLERAA